MCNTEHLQNVYDVMSLQPLLLIIKMNPVIVYLYSTANLSHPFQVNEGNYSSCHDIIPHFNTDVHPREERGKGKTGACPLLDIYELHRREIIETKNMFNLQLFSYFQQRNNSSEINM